MRYFSDGAVIGSREFVEAQTEVDGVRDHASHRKRRRRGVSFLAGGTAELFSLRNLQVEDPVVGAGGLQTNW